jgi:carboxypeptidase Taq
MQAYKTLEKVFSKLNDLDQAQSLLHWDMATYMPITGASSRAQQLATLTSLHHAILTDEGVDELMSAAEKESSKLKGWDKANYYEMRRLHTHAKAVPTNLVKALSIASSNCEMVWRKARPENDFKTLTPYLKEVVKLVREVATAKSQVLKCSPYDALIDQYDPGMNTARIDPIFDNLKNWLPDFIPAVLEKQRSKPAREALKGPFPKEKQKELAEEMMKIVGFDTSWGRLDESVHPFCTGHRGDVRITTRYNEDDFMASFMGVLHETGHAMYDAGLPEAFLSQPVGRPRGMSVHESQSLMIEMQVCRSEAFLEFAVPVMKRIFAKKTKAWSVENIKRHVQHVEPSLIRVDADEVTYPAHILLRYYIERYLIDGSMEVEDLPDAWAQGMEKFLGVKVKDDKDGCMQDIHWMDGTFGYFPSYTLGAMMAAQFTEAAITEDESIPNAITKGDFSPLMKWLRTQVHEQASLFPTHKLLNRATGKDLDVDVYKAHLTRRYLEG